MEKETNPIKFILLGVLVVVLGILLWALFGGNLGHKNQAMKIIFEKENVEVTNFEGFVGLAVRESKKWSPDTRMYLMFYRNGEGYDEYDMSFQSKTMTVNTPQGVRPKSFGICYNCKLFNLHYDKDYKVSLYESKAEKNYKMIGVETEYIPGGGIDNFKNDFLDVAKIKISGAEAYGRISNKSYKLGAIVMVDGKPYWRFGSEDYVDAETGKYFRKNELGI